MTNLTHLTLAQACSALEKKEITATELTSAYLDNIEKAKPLNAYIHHCDSEMVMAQAKACDARIQAGEKRPIEGIPLAIKDNFCTKDVPTTACSNILRDFKPVYESTVTQNLWDGGAIMMGKLNMDEFGMGSSNEHSIFGPAINPWRKKDSQQELVPGGSSGGSASAVSSLLCLGATATDTGGSIRQPASFTGTVGIKPTYGRCSRFGLISYASSMDQAGPIARTTEDAAILLSAMAGYDPKDSTSVNTPVPPYRESIGRSVKGLTIGLVTDFQDYMSEDIQQLCAQALAIFKDAGCSIQNVSLPVVPRSLEVYYVIAPAECSSNLARYDGVRYGYRHPEASSLEEIYKLSRTHGFGEEVKRRIMLGVYALSVGHSDEYYRKATKVRRLIYEDFFKAFKKVDAILTPATPSPAFARGQRANPLEMYSNDIMTVPVNLVGLPAISVPGGFSSEGLPLGLQLIGRPFAEETLFSLAHTLEKNVQMSQHLLNLERWWEA